MEYGLTELLSNLDLEYYCHKLNIKLNAILSKDLLKSHKPQLGCYVINLQDSTAGGGTHWVACILFKCTIIYFDPFGVPPPTEFVAFARRFKKQQPNPSSLKIIYSVDKIQDLDSVYCGWFCLYFLIYMTRNKCNDKKKSVLLNLHNAQYDKQNEKKNDLLIKQFIQEIFSNLIT